MFKNKIKAVLIDLNGTLHIENTAVPGAVDALNRLRESNVNIRFVTNTTKESKRLLWERLVGLGFSLKPEEMFSSLIAAKELIVSRQLRPMLFLEKIAMEDFNDIETENPNAVVIGLAPSTFHYENLNKAFRLLLNGAHFIGIHKGRYYKLKDGLALGPGPFISGLEYATSKTAEIVGKPETLFFHQALSSINCKPEEAVMIGDDVRDDVEGAQRAGITGMLVKTGKYRPGDEETISPSPNHVFDSFSTAVDYLLENLI
ncbi:haloacid dehalogenase-like hydrolase domain-containing protein 2 [Centruroides vittatus]|uniref:haloacid dehalogenase-like hydrolase domain-containing protein 2 n=1 Tax=Centruroides vittatus TaxID=120091 RepID=UPI00350FBAB7